VRQQNLSVRFQRGNRLTYFWPRTPKVSTRGALPSVDLIGRVAVPPQLAIDDGRLTADAITVNSSEGLSGTFGVEADRLCLFNGS